MQARADGGSMHGGGSHGGSRGCISFVRYYEGGAVGVADDLGVEGKRKRHQGRLQGLGLSGWKEGVPSAAGGAPP